MRLYRPWFAAYFWTPQCEPRNPQCNEAITVRRTCWGSSACAESSPTLVLAKWPLFYPASSIPHHPLTLAQPLMSPLSFLPQTIESAMKPLDFRTFTCWTPLHGATVQLVSGHWS